MNYFLRTFHNFGTSYKFHFFNSSNLLVLTTRIWRSALQSNFWSPPYLENDFWINFKCNFRLQEKMPRREPSNHQPEDETMGDAGEHGQTDTQTQREKDLRPQTSSLRPQTSLFAIFIWSAYHNPIFEASNTSRTFEKYILKKRWVNIHF